MPRLAGTLLASVFALAPAAASVPADLPKLPRPEAAPVKKTTPVAAPSGEFQLTKATEVLLDGRPCAYKDVPATAAVVRVEVADDQTTVLRIEFRTRR